MSGVRLGAARDRLRHRRGKAEIPRRCDACEVGHAALQQVRRLFEQWQAAGLNVNTVSMGMSNDLEAAVEEELPEGGEGDIFAEGADWG